MVTSPPKAPIAVFVYNRPEHTRKMLLNLQNCEGFDESLLFVFCDGAKNEESQYRVNEARDVVHAIVGKGATIIEAQKNMGLANSIIRGVTQLCDEYGQVIVLEDDLIVSPNFLRYMNVALMKYKTEEKVMQISGHMFDVPEFKTMDEAIFLPFTTSWGWATWKRAWDHFDVNAKDWENLKGNPQLRKDFNLGGVFDYYSMLMRQINGKSDSWAIRWYWSVFKQHGIVLYPPQSLVGNTGFDGSGTHGWITARQHIRQTELVEKNIHLPDSIVVKLENFEAVRSSLNKMNKGLLGWLRGMKSTVLGAVS